MDKISKYITQIQQRRKRKNTKNRLEVADLGDREDIKLKVLARVKKWERLVFKIATFLKWPLCFGAPVAVIAFAILVLICLFNVGPYNTAKRFAKTSCAVVNVTYDMDAIGSCKYRRIIIQPCWQILVKYNTTDGLQQLQGVLMEDEQANSLCDKCSYTNAVGRPFSTGEVCSWNNEIKIEDCTYEYYVSYERLFNSTISCYYDPEKKGDVIVKKEITFGQMFYQLGIPIIYLVVFLAGLGILIYSFVSNRITIIRLLHEEEERQALNGAAKGIDLSKDSVDDSLHTGPSSTAIKRKRKKKMPCCRSHNFFGLEEAIVLEQKPISPLHGDQLSSSINVELQPFCSRHQNTSEGSWGFERIKQTEDELRPVMSAFDGTQPSSTRLFRYLPESVV